MIDLTPYIDNGIGVFFALLFYWDFRKILKKNTDTIELLVKRIK